MSTSPNQIQSRINAILKEIMTALYKDPPEIPMLLGKHFDHLSQARSFTSIILVLSYVQKLKPPYKTSTNREVYYYFITHFRSQQECDDAIADTCRVLNCDRISLGLSASPKGWYACCFCGIEIQEGDGSVKNINFESGSSVHGLPITREWIERASVLADALEEKDPSRITTIQFGIHSNSKCIVVVEKEGIYTRLIEDRNQLPFPVILVTGKGFSDIATRALVYVLHNLLDLPVYGLCDCNPYGLAVLKTYYTGSMGKKRIETMEGGLRYSVPIQWLGLRPSHVKAFCENEVRIPQECFQALTDMDRKRIAHLMNDELVGTVQRNAPDSDESNNNDEQPQQNNIEIGFMTSERREELQLMNRLGWKVELECLNWLGMEFISEWLAGLLIANVEESHHSLADLRRAI